jgi:polysaccharide export outer membrane protein
MKQGLRSSIQDFAWSGMLAALVLLASAKSSAAEYRIAPGDVIEVTIAGVPEQRQRATVQFDGTISLPGVGSVVVGGLAPTELQARMETLLPTRILKVRTPDGRERPLIIRPADVAASVVEYRPIYVTGDVLTPGQQPYRPLMTVRQAVAVAGGYSMLRSRSAQAGADPVELRREYETSAIEYTKEQLRIARTEAELKGRDTINAGAMRGVPVSSDLVAAIAKSEDSILKTAQSEYSGQRAFLDESLRKGDEQIAILKKQEAGEAKGVAFDEQDLDRVLKLYSAGSSTNPRVMEARRAVLLSSTRQLQTSAELMRVQRQQDEVRRQLDKLDNDRRVRLLTELNDANIRLADARTRMQAAAQKLHPLGGAGPAPVGVDNVRPQVAVFRRAGRSWSRLPAAEDFEVEPGDVIEVALPASLPQAASN